MPRVNPVSDAVVASIMVSRKKEENSRNINKWGMSFSKV